MMVVFLPCRNADAKEFDASVDPSSEDNFYEASVRLWLPDSGQPVQGILVMVGGTDSDWRGMTSSEPWRSFAGKHRLAVVGCHFRGNGEPYEQAALGSGDALMKMIDRIASDSGRKELRSVPLLLCGYSSGAMFAYNFARWVPQRCGGFVSVKSGPIEPDPDAGRIPGMFLVGEKDSGRIRSAASAFAARSPESRWALAVEPNEGHGFTDACTRLAVAYFQALIERQANDREPRRNGRDGILRSLAKPSLANFSGGEVADVVWLPSERVASDWRAFTKAVSVADLMQSPDESWHAMVTVQPSVIDFGTIDVSEGTRRTIEKLVAIRLDSPDLRNVSFVSDAPEISVTSQAGQGSAYRLKVRLDSEALRGGQYRGAIHVKAGDADVSPIQVIASVVGELSATPSSLYLGVLPRGSVVEKEIEITSGKGIDSLKVSSSNPAFAAVKTMKTSGSKVAITVRFDGAGKHLGNQSGYLEIKSGKFRSVRVPFIAWMAK